MKLHRLSQFPSPDCFSDEDVSSWVEEQRVSRWRCEWNVEFIGSLRLCIFRGCVICGMIWVRRINLGEARWNAERVIMLRQEHHPQPSQEKEREEKAQSCLSKRSVILKVTAGMRRKRVSGADTTSHELHRELLPLWSHACANRAWFLFRAQCGRCLFGVYLSWRGNLSAAAGYTL